MQRFPIKAVLAASLLALLSAPVAVQAQKAQPQPRAEAPVPHAPHAAGPMALPMPAPGRMAGGLALAAHLSATETYLGITPEQQGPWRDYCQALVGFMQPEPPPGPEAGQLMAERMAQAVLARADKAQALLVATTALRGALQPEQLARLVESQPGPQGAERPDRAG